MLLHTYCHGNPVPQSADLDDDIELVLSIMDELTKELIEEGVLEPCSNQHCNTQCSSMHC